MEIRAINLRTDYKNLTIESFDGKYLIEWENNNSGQVQVRQTLSSAKSFCTKEIQNPKWGKEYPKLKWE